MTPYDLIVKCCHICLGKKKKATCYLRLKAHQSMGTRPLVLTHRIPQSTTKKGCIENNTIDKLIIAWEKVT